MIYFTRTWQYKHLNMYTTNPAVLTTARRLWKERLRQDKKNKKLKKRVAVQMSIFCREFSLSFKYGLGWRCNIFSFKICCYLKFFKFRPFTLFLFTNNVSTRHAVTFTVLEFLEIALYGKIICHIFHKMGRAT